MMEPHESTVRSGWVTWEPRRVAAADLETVLAVQERSLGPGA